MFGASPLQPFAAEMASEEKKQEEKKQDDKNIEKKENDDDDGFEICEIGDPIINNNGVKFKSYRRERWFDTKNRMQFINITQEIEQMLKESNIKDGIVLVSPMHITASVIVQDDDKSLHSDFQQYLENLVPNDEDMTQGLYNHNSWGDSNGDSHIKRQLFKREIWISVTNGTFDFGKNEQIIYAEFDGRRRKRVLIKMLGY